MSQHQTITCEELAKQCADGPIDLIDVRTPVEFQSVHSVAAKNVPLQRLDPDEVMNKRRGDASDPVYVICASGQRAAKACTAFVDAGYNNVVNVEGGTNAWVEAGLPIQRGRKMMSLERQVRIAAGLLILAGVGLSWLHPWWIGLSAFVGAGLVFAGVTDTCGMAMLLTWMPWNRVPPESDPVDAAPDTAAAESLVGSCCD